MVKFVVCAIAVLALGGALYIQPKVQSWWDRHLPGGD
jgi:hypothetical protein